MPHPCSSSTERLDGPASTSLPPLPDEILSEINTLINQNQLYIELLASKHCELQQKLANTRGFEQKTLHFTRRRDLRFLFECGEQILTHYRRQHFQEHHQHQQHDVTGARSPVFERGMSLSVKSYVRELLNSFVESRLQCLDIEDDRESVVSQGLLSIQSSASSDADVLSLSTTSTTSSRSSIRSRDAVYDSEECVEVQLEFFAPSVTFNESVQYFEC